MSSGRPSTNRTKVILAASSRGIVRVPPSAGKSTAFMLELWSSATTIATPFPAICVLPPTVCGRASATASAAIASPRNAAGSGRSQTQPGRFRGPKPSKLGQPIRGRQRSSSHGNGTRTINQNQPGFANCQLVIGPWSLVLGQLYPPRDGPSKPWANKNKNDHREYGLQAFMTE